MTIDEFKKNYGADYVKQFGKPWFQALLTLIQDTGPVSGSVDRPAGDIVVGGHVLYAEVQGYQKVLHLLKTLPDTQKPNEAPESEYR
jgi:hypothetical protein